jgi:hypothetical protein
MDLTTREAHELTRYSESHLRSLAREKRVLARKSGRIWLYDQEVLRLYATGEWVGIREASELTGYSHDHLRKLARTKRLKALKIRDFWLLHRRDLLDYRTPEREKYGIRPTVFVSYSHEDSREKDALLSHLGVLAGDDLINLDVWTDDRIPAGADWEGASSDRHLAHQRQFPHFKVHRQERSPRTAQTSRQRGPHCHSGDCHSVCLEKGQMAQRNASQAQKRKTHLEEWWQPGQRRVGCHC